MMRIMFALKLSNMNSSKYRVFVCTKKRAAGDPDGCCCDRGALNIYQAFQDEVESLQLRERVEIRNSGCLDRCEAGVVAMVCQPRRRELDWLPTKVRVKLRKIMFPNHMLYGNLQPEDVMAIAESHFVRGKVYLPKHLS